MKIRSDRILVAAHIIHRQFFKFTRRSARIIEHHVSEYILTSYYSKNFPASIFFEASFFVITTKQK